jgi:hypothetical protein
MTGLTRRQRADQILGQMVQQINGAFPGVKVDVQETGPEKEDGIIVVHLPEAQMEKVFEVIGDLLMEAMGDQSLVIVVRAA